MTEILHLVKFAYGADVMRRACDGTELPYEEPRVEENIDECAICVVCEDLAIHEGVPLP